MIYDTREFTPETILEDQLAVISSQVKVDTIYTTFEYKGHQYYPDFESIIGIIIMALIDPTFTIQWKTADKLKDGITNIYVDLISQDIIQLGISYFQHRSSIWSEGDARKIVLKEGYKDASTES